MLQKDSQRSTPRSHVHECKRGGAIKASLVPAKRRSRAAAAQQQRRGKKAEAREPDSAGVLDPRAAAARVSWGATRRQGPVARPPRGKRGSREGQVCFSSCFV